MAIKYYLQNNPVTPDPNDCLARVLTHQTLKVEQVVKEMLRRGSTATEADCEAVLRLFFEVVSDEIAEGNNIILPLVNIRPAVNGVFKGATDSFDPSRHIKKATFSAGTMITKKVIAAKVEKIVQPISIPTLIEYTDINSGTTNSIVTPGGIGQIMGEELKYNPTNASEGIFFIAADGTATKVSIVARRTLGRLIFSIPTLAIGNYHLEVRKGYGTSTIVLRTGILQDELQVL
jgi:DNA-binding domain/Domain of unknown function (DUF4469) with IG-like fold